MNLELRLRGNKWYVVGSVLQHGSRVPVRQSTGYTKPYKNMASDKLLEIQRDVLAGNFGTANTANKATVQTAIDLYENRPEGIGKTEQTIMRKFGEALGHVKLNTLKASDIHLYTQARGNKAGTVRRELNAIMAMLTHASGMGLDVPTLEVKKPKVDDSRVRWLTEAERDHLINHCPPEIKGLVTFLFFTGARLGEARSLKWHDVVNTNATMGTRKGISKKLWMRSVPLHSRAIDAMGPRGSGYVFTTPTGLKWENNGVYRYFGPACEAAGVEDFTPHDCRHTFASHLVQKGATLKAVADLLGHRSLSMVMRYAHLAPTHLETTIVLL